MLKVNNTSVMNFEGALRGMRNQMNSWDKSDYDICTNYISEINCNNCQAHQRCNNKFVIGVADLNLAKKIVLAGSSHRKFLRQIFVLVDIIAPVYWWKEFDTYKVGTVANSTSTMHKLSTKPIQFDDFSVDYEILDKDDDLKRCFNDVLAQCEDLHKRYNETKDKGYCRDLIQLLPCSYNQTRTVTMNYENLIGMYRDRRNHKLS